MLEIDGPKKINTTWRDRVAAGVAYLIATPFLLAGVGIIGMQVYGYLRYSEWAPFTVMSLLEGSSPWLNNPQSWLGWHEIVYGFVDWLPVSLLSLFLGWMFWSIARSISDP